MAIGEADIFQVVVLAARAHALLRSRSARVIALLQPKEDVLELVHARIGEEQRRVVGRHQRRRVHFAVSLLNKEVEKFAADFGASKHGSLNSKSVLSCQLAVLGKNAASET